MRPIRRESLLYHLSTFLASPHGYSPFPSSHDQPSHLAKQLPYTFVVRTMSDIDHGKTMSDTDHGDQKYGISDEPVSVNINDVLPSGSDTLQTRILASANHRRLNARQIQLTSIAGSIGAALFVAIGSGVLSGPLCLLIGESVLSIRNQIK